MAKGKKTGGRQPGSRNKTTIDVRDIAQKYGKDAVKKAASLAGLLPNEEGKAVSEQARIAALNIILDRAWGKPAQAITGEGGEGPIEMKVTLSFD